MSEITKIRREIQATFDELGDPTRKIIRTALSRRMDDNGYDHFVKSMTGSLSGKQKAEAINLLSQMRSDAKAKRQGSV